MSESESYLRIQAARLGRRFPLILERIGAGQLNLTAVKLLAPHLSEDNCGALLDRVRGKRKRDVEQLVAELAPKPDVPERVRQLPPRPAARGAVRAQQALASGEVPHALVEAVAPEAATPVAAAAQVQPGTSSSTSTFALQPTRPRATATPLRPGRYKLELTLDQEVHDKLEQLRELLRHSHPDGDLASIIERAVRELHERTLQKRFAKKKEKAVASRQEPDRERVRSRYVPREVVREVYERDQGQCSFVSPSGRRCSTRSFLELHHHETTFARGGAATADNLRLMCRVHNALQAERAYGRSFMHAKLKGASSQRRELVPERQQV